MYAYQDCGNFCTVVFIFAEGAKTAPIEKILYHGIHVRSLSPQAGSPLTTKKQTP